jgi:manganese oxidase
MSQHDHEHMSDPPPKGADDQHTTDGTTADPAHTHDHHAQPASGDRQAASAGDGTGHAGQADGHGSHEGMGHGGMSQMAIPLAYRPTRAQIAAVSFLSVLALVAALIFSASYANLRLSARDVGGAIMPPGMIMTYDTPLLKRIRSDSL